MELTTSVRLGIFINYTKLAILASEALQCENKKKSQQENISED